MSPFSPKYNKPLHIFHNFSLILTIKTPLSLQIYLKKVYIALLPTLFSDVHISGFIYASMRKFPKPLLKSLFEKRG